MLSYTKSSVSKWWHIFMSRWISKMVHWQENSIITIKIHLENKWEEGIALNVNVEKNKPDLAKKKKKSEHFRQRDFPKAPDSADLAWLARSRWMSVIKDLSLHLLLTLCSPWFQAIALYNVQILAACILREHACSTQSTFYCWNALEPLPPKFSEAWVYHLHST